MGLEVRLLGPLEVLVDGAPVWITGRPSVLLAVLAMSAGHIVSPDRLAAAVWGHDPPDNPRGSVQTNVTRLRRLIGADLVETGSAGYVLRAAPAEIDALRFLGLLDEASSTSDRVAEHRALSEALALWRGTPFEGVRSAWLAESEAPHLVERYLAAVERHTDLDLAAGRHDGVAARLRELTAQYPLREPLWVRLLSVLDLTGRRAEGLELYETVRRQLADELGADPGPQLQAMHAKLLSDQPLSHVVPRQLPADVAGFVGRDKVLATMDSRLGDAGAPLVITAIGGAGGIGKTALAVHWAHRVAGWFPDGQLYANLRGFDPSGSPRAPEEVMRGFLDALAVPPQQVPSGFEAQAGLYRSLLTGRRMLVVLDNARDAEQVRPLLPGSPGSQVVVTSRDGLTGLIAAEGARPVVLDVLSAEEAWQLLERRLGGQRTGSDPQATEEVIARCAGLPLALSVVAARAAQRPDTAMSAFAAELEGTRADLDAFAHNDPMTDVRAVFSWSYRTLSAPAARLFRLLSVHPGPDVSAAAAASIAGLSPARTRPLLMELTAAHMFNETTADRFTSHDLLRAYSVELAERVDPAEERRAALLRMLDHYLHTGYAAARALDPARVPIPMPAPLAGVTPEPIPERGQAVRWFTAERPVLVAAVHRAVAAEADQHTWRLAWTVVGFLDMVGHWHERVALLHATVGITPRDSEWPWQAFVHRNLGHAYVRTRRLDDAHAHLRQALELFARAGDRSGQARTHLIIGMVHDRQRRHAEGLVHALAAFDLFGAAGNTAGQADALNAVGWDHAQLGNLEEALKYCQQSLELHRGLDHKLGRADAWDSLGYVHYRLSNHDEAVASYEQALHIFRDVDDRFDEATTLTNLGDTHLAMGDRARAEEVWRQALAIFNELHQAGAAASVQEKLNALG
ncbi:AfsR/SARP family transcriptional regulator [Allorhizocola rhizosphaerae]|uniref:AfsR/SARP family transcriptional regulator n=1 Tax=Allorhizocola rhizosphaerae TaxID=1872709 RepID=UPI000E3DCC71|nr:BTAD domain-containing putative transcriptional regulator [Allorhizocola rhizosphaerae]